jgi:hypothetical protein
MLVVQERSRFSLLVCICYRMIPAVLMKVMGEEAEETTNLQVPKKKYKKNGEITCFPSTKVHMLTQLLGGRRLSATGFSSQC